MTVAQILSRIVGLQSAEGLFPSKRVNEVWGYKRLDTNLFFTAITFFTLKNSCSHLPSAQRQAIDALGERARSAYDRFRNKDGLKTYNFYPTRPSQHFPNGYVFRHFKHFQLPDDADDTALVYLTTHPTPENLLWLKNKLAQHANPAHSTAPTTFADCQQLTAYATWFGKHMPIEFDACVLSNVLYAIYYYDLPRNQHDADSLWFLRWIVETDRYRTHPFRCAHNYATTSLIIYHIARFMAAFDPSELRSIGPKLVADAYLELGRATNQMDKLLLAISLLRLGQNPPSIDLSGIERYFDGFYFFRAGLLSAYPQPWLYRHAHRPFWHIGWECEAHNWALVLEYRVLAGK